jgi:hypothetical protein
MVEGALILTRSYHEHWYLRYPAKECLSGMGTTGSGEKHGSFKERKIRRLDLQALLSSEILDGNGERMCCSDHSVLGSLLFEWLIAGSGEWDWIYMGAVKYANSYSENNFNEPSNTARMKIELSQPI